jgi:CO/xanthine dehydrogenase Mo-binding subunit
MSESHIAVGKSLQRIDGVDKVTGSAKYAADIKLENMLHAKLLRSPHAHAKVIRIDTSAAEKLPGVRAFTTIFEAPKVIEYWFSLRTEKKKKQILSLRIDTIPPSRNMRPLNPLEPALPITNPTGN